jgi:hypothetical protein
VRRDGADTVIQVAPHWVVWLEPRTEFFDEVKFANSGQANNHWPVDVHFGYFEVERFEVLRMFIKDYDFNVKNVADGSTVLP